MTDLADVPSWVFLVFCIFILLGVAAFFVRNHEAKTDRNPIPQKAPKESESIAITRGKK